MRSATLKRILDKWPGKKTLGVYRFLPTFVCLGAFMEFAMINWRSGQTNFYETYKRREAKNIIESIINEERLAAR